MTGNVSHFSHRISWPSHYGAHYKGCGLVVEGAWGGGGDGTRGAASIYIE